MLLHLWALNLCLHPVYESSHSISYSGQSSFRWCWRKRCSIAPSEHLLGHISGYLWHLGKWSAVTPSCVKSQFMLACKHSFLHGHSLDWWFTKSRLLIHLLSHFKGHSTSMIWHLPFNFRWWSRSPNSLPTGNHEAYLGCSTLHFENRSSLQFLYSGFLLHSRNGLSSSLSFSAASWERRCPQQEY